MTAPVLTHASYNAATGLLTLTGSHLTTKAGDYTATDFTLTGDGGGSYTLSSGSAIFGALVGTSVTIKLSGTDQLAIDGLLNKNGTQANDGITTYNLSATSGWDSNASAITTEGVTVSGVTAPVITTVSYNATTGAFSFTGTNLDNHGSGNGIAQTAFTLTGGKSGSYHFNAGDTVSDLGKTGFTITLDSTDLALVNAFVNKNGTSPLSGSAYNLTATSKWDSDSGAAITSKPVTVNGIPANLNSAAYNAATGTLTLNGGNLSGKAADYQVSAFTLTGDGGNSVALSSGSMISGVPTSSSVVITLSTADQLAVDGLLNKNGAQANDGVTTYNLSASAGWDTYAKPITTEGLMVSGITPPAIATVNYNAATGVFTFTGSNLDNHGSGNGIALNAFTLTGGNSGSFHFSASDTVSNLGRTGFAISLSAADQAAVAAFVTKNGPLPLSGAAYNLTATSKWDSDSGAAITTKAVLASGVPLPATLSSASYNAATGSLTLNGNHFSASADVYSVSDFTLKGDGGATYALSSGSLVSGTPPALA